MEDNEQPEEVETEETISTVPDVSEEQVINASFVYSVINGDNESPYLKTELDTPTTDNLESLAALIAPMSHPQFFYLVVSKIQQDFMEQGKELDLAFFMKKLEEKKAEFDSSMGEPYITPLELSRRPQDEK